MDRKRSEENMAKIVVVDDEQYVRSMLKKFLTSKGYQVYVAGSGEEALPIIKEEKPNIVLLDIMMPGMDGMECLRLIKEIDKEIGVIMLTAVQEEKTAKEAIKLGAFEYLVKPFSFEYLQNALMVKLL
jgi:two-component system, NtrC family, response regulator AtoC